MFNIFKKNKRLSVKEHKLIKKFYEHQLPSFLNDKISNYYFEEFYIGFANQLLKKNSKGIALNIGRADIPYIDEKILYELEKEFVNQSVEKIESTREYLELLSQVIPILNRHIISFSYAPFAKAIRGYNLIKEVLGKFTGICEGTVKIIIDDENILLKLYFINEKSNKHFFNNSTYEYATMHFTLRNAKIIYSIFDLNIDLIQKEIDFDDIYLLYTNEGLSVDLGDGIIVFECAEFSLDMITINHNINYIDKVHITERLKKGQNVFKNFMLDNIEMTNLDLSNAIFINCFMSFNLSNSNLTNAQIRNSNFKACNIQNCVFDNTIIQGCVVDFTDFSNIKIGKMHFINNYAQGSKLVFTDNGIAVNKNCIVLEAEIVGEFENCRKSGNPIYSGYRPQHILRNNEYGDGVYTFINTDIVKLNEKVLTKVRFLSPEYFAKTLHVGKKIAVMEGANVHGYLTVKNILNKIMDETYDLISDEDDLLSDKYKYNLVVLKSIIYYWDPVNILKYKLLDDEYEKEIEELMPYLFRNNNILAEAIQKIFNKNFNILLNEKKCQKIAKKIFKAIK